MCTSLWATPGLPRCAQAVARGNLLAPFLTLDVSGESHFEQAGGQDLTGCCYGTLSGMGSGSLSSRFPWQVLDVPAGSFLLACERCPASAW